MKILITGASGLVGSALTEHLRQSGHDPYPVPRMATTDGIGTFAPDPGCDAIVHLAGESIVEGRWTPAKKQRIRQSRAILTERLVQSLATLTDPPKILVSASAIGFYGNRGDEVLSEASPRGTGFLAEVCAEWEAAARAASANGVRVVHLRIGVVLSRHGGALRKMLLPFRLGLGGPFGDGRDWMSWIHIDDLIRLIAFALENSSLAGALNAVAPTPVTNRTFAKTLGSVLRRPAVLPVPRFVLRLALGEVADEVLLSSARVHPERALAAGFEFRHPELATALGELL